MMHHPLPDISLIIFDADGTIRGCLAHGGAPCHNGPGEWYILPNVHDVLDQYDWSHVGFGIASNQAGIALGYTTHQVVEQQLRIMIAHVRTPMKDTYRLTRDGSPVYRYAPYAPDASSYCRKPSPWMLLDLVRAYEERLDQTVYVGDSPEDEEAARRAGVMFYWAWDFFNRPSQIPNLVKAHEQRKI